MGARVAVPRKILQWAIDRSLIDGELLLRKVEHLQEWLDGYSSPTVKQLEDFAKTTHTPFGYLFLDEPPQEDIRLPDFRTFTERATNFLTFFRGIQVSWLGTPV